MSSKKPLKLSICIPSINADELVNQLLVLEDSMRNFKFTFEVIVQYDTKFENEVFKVSESCGRLGYSLLSPINNGLDASIHALLTQASGEFIWVLSGNDSINADTLNAMGKAFQTDNIGLIFLNSKTPDGLFTAINTTGHDGISDFNTLLVTIGTRMSLITSLVFLNTFNESDSVLLYEKYCGTNIAFLTIPFFSLEKGRKAYVVRKPVFTNNVVDLKKGEKHFYNGTETFGAFLICILLEFSGLFEKDSWNNFLKQNYSSLWKGAVIDWVRNDHPTPLFALLKLYQYYFHLPLFYASIFICALPRPLAKFCVEFAVRKKHTTSDS